MDYSTNLKFARKKWAKLTQEQLAKRAGLSTVTIRQYEAGKRKPTMENWIAIANALYLSVDELNNATALPLDGVYFGDEVFMMEEMDKEWAKQSRCEIRELISLYYELNFEGQGKALERIRELTEIPRYQAKGGKTENGIDTEEGQRSGENFL